MGFMDDINAETKQYGGGSSGNFYEFKDGINRMRILVQPKVIAYHFPPTGRPDTCIGIDDGCTHHKATDKKPTIRLVTYIIDRDDSDKIKLAELPLSISYAINDLQQDPDFSFEGFPMPYDVKITHDPKNSDPKAKYRLVASPKHVPLTDGEETALSEALKKMTPEQFVESKKNKQKGNAPENAPEEVQDIDPRDIPF